MIQLQDPSSLQQTLSALSSNQSIGFVPTMGGLHAGHLELIKTAKKNNDICVVSVFLNPTQFDNSEDLNSYPADLNEDLILLKQAGVDYLFTPKANELYPDGYAYKVKETDLSEKLCGSSRPGHFDGVLSVVLKLLNIVAPTRAYFGEKDHQQLQLIRGMVQAFFIPTEVIAVPTVRDDHGLALSSRNKRLSSSGLVLAQTFATELKKQQSLDKVVETLEEKNIKIDYLEDLNNRRYAAVEIEGVRLIDNVEI